MEKGKTTVRLMRNATLRIHYAEKDPHVDPFYANKYFIHAVLGMHN